MEKLKDYVSIKLKSWRKKKQIKNKNKKQKKN